jgi:two-component system, cell cycle response regulator
MTVSQINVLALSKNGRRMVGTVITCVRSAKFVFKLMDEGSEAIAHIAVVDEEDAQMRAQLALERLRNPKLAVIYFVRALSTTPSQRHELLSVQLVSHLMPMLERAAANSSFLNTPTVNTAAPNNIMQLVVTPRRERLSALVVDDSPTVRTQLSRTLDRMGMLCDVAENGYAALALLSARTYHIIYVDVVMPDMDGYKLTREIKHQAKHKATPVVILTSRSSPFDRARGSLAGCDTYLTKPVELKRFYEATSNCLAKSMAVADMREWLTDPTLTNAPAPVPAAHASTTTHNAMPGRAPTNSR